VVASLWSITWSGRQRSTEQVIRERGSTTLHSAMSEHGKWGYPTAMRDVGPR
jgi:hypothetical protein